MGKSLSSCSVYLIILIKLSILVVIRAIEFGKSRLGIENEFGSRSFKGLIKIITTD